MPHDLTELMSQVQNAVDRHQRSCLVCFFYKMSDQGKFIRCYHRQRVWEYADRLSPQHEVKCLHRARNCKTFSPEVREKLHEDSNDG